MSDDVSLTTPLADLIARLERATKNDRRLDWAVHCFLRGVDPNDRSMHREWVADAFPYYSHPSQKHLTFAALKARSAT